MWLFCWAGWLEGWQWRLGFVWRGGLLGCEVLPILAEVEECVAKLAIERDLITADEFDAGDVVGGGRDGGVVGLGIV